MQSITLPLTQPLKLWVLRLDKNDSLISGNKFYKLKPWVNQALKQNKALVSCGGAYSNHLHALAAAGLKHNIPTYGLVRALEINNPTITLQDCIGMGMTLIPVTRDDYKKRYHTDFLKPYQHHIKQDSLWIAEGGMGELAINACEDIGNEINAAMADQPFNAVYIAVGSGGTLAGIARKLHSNIQLFAVPVIKHWQDVKTNVDNYLTTEQAQRIEWLGHAFYGGFAKANATHIEFMAQFEALTDIPLDPVYTSKVFRKVIELHLTQSNPEHRPLVIHTGGLQGRRSIVDKIKQVKTSPEYFSSLEKLWH